MGSSPGSDETVVSQLARQVFGGGPLYYYIQAVTMLILVLAANTAFADFPRLAFFMARDGYLPRQFRNRGDRLVFSNGVVILARSSPPCWSSLFHGEHPRAHPALRRRRVHLVHPVPGEHGAAAGSRPQAGGLVVARRRQRRGRAHHRHSCWCVVAATKFIDGAWIVVLLIAALVMVILAIRRHYDERGAASSRWTAATRHHR